MPIGNLIDVPERGGINPKDRGKVSIVRRVIDGSVSPVAKRIIAKDLELEAGIFTLLVLALIGEALGVRVSMTWYAFSAMSMGFFYLSAKSYRENGRD